jgi:hypothetical protein
MALDAAPRRGSVGAARGSREEGEAALSNEAADSTDIAEVR